MRCPQSFLAGLGLLADFMGRLHDHRAERHRLGSVQAEPIHRDAKKTSRTEGLYVRVLLLQMATQAFLAVVHAENDLGIRPPVSSCVRPAWVVLPKRGKQLVTVVVLVGFQP